MPPRNPGPGIREDAVDKLLRGMMAMLFVLTAVAFGWTLYESMNPSRTQAAGAAPPIGHTVHCRSWGARWRRCY